MRSWTPIANCGPNSRVFCPARSRFGVSAELLLTGEDDLYDGEAMLEAALLSHVRGTVLHSYWMRIPMTLLRASMYDPDRAVMFMVESAAEELVDMLVEAGTHAPDAACPLTGAWVGF